MEATIQKTLTKLLEKVSKNEGDKKLRIASLWEDVSKKVTNKTQIFKIENKIIFIKVSDPIIAQELKLKVQLEFVKKYKEAFNEEIKDVRFIVGN